MLKVATRSDLQGFYRNGTTLSNALQKAADKGIKVIAYDRLIKGSKNVDYHATFDNFQVGVLQAQSIEKALKLKDAKGPFNIELFGGSPDDNNAFFFYDGAMSVLKPVSVDVGNWKEVLISSGYYKENQVKQDRIRRSFKGCTWTRSWRCAASPKPSPASLRSTACTSRCALGKSTRWSLIWASASSSWSRLPRRCPRT